MSRTIHLPMLAFRIAPCDQRLDVGRLAIEVKKRIEKIRQEIRALARDQNSNSPLPTFRLTRLAY
jgi:hypothetical protein